LTTAVLGSVDTRHTGSASGFNSAVARTGGLVATALLGAVLAMEGDLLLRAFHTALWIGAAASARRRWLFLPSLIVDAQAPSPRPDRAWRAVTSESGLTAARFR